MMNPLFWLQAITLAFSQIWANKSRAFLTALGIIVGVASTTALIAALKSGRLGGVALDVYEEEEGVFFEDLSGEILQDDELSRLLTFPNVLITAHQAFLTREALSEIARVSVANLKRFAASEPFIEGTEL